MRFRELAIKAATSKYLALAFRLYLGGIFIYASLHKISYPGEFAESIASYQVAPYWAINVLGVMMSWVELICGVLLVAGIRSKSAVCMIGGMLAMFTVVIALALIRQIPAGCGCFSSTGDPIRWSTVARDLIWLAMAVHVYLFDSLLQLERKFFVRLAEI